MEGRFLKVTFIFLYFRILGCWISQELCGSEINIGKGKAIPLQALTFPEGSRRLRIPDFMTIGT
jgi:hypothetical protein